MFSFSCSLCGTNLDLGRKSAKHKKLEASQTSKSANMLLSWANSIPSGTSQSENAATNDDLNDLENLNADSSKLNYVR